MALTPLNKAIARKLDIEDTKCGLLNGIFAFFQENYLIRMTNKQLVKTQRWNKQNYILIQGGRYGRSGNH